MKSMCTLIVAAALVLTSGTTKAQTTYTINADRTWQANNGDNIPTTCVNCTFNIASGVTLTIDKNITLQNCTFNGGTVSITDKSMTIQMMNGSGQTNFTGTNLLAYGSASITGSAPVYVSNATFKFYNTSYLNTQQLFDVTNSKIYFYDDSYLLATGGPVNLKTNSLLVAGNGTPSSKAYIKIYGPQLSMYDASAVLLSNNNNYYFNWSPYLAASKNSWVYTSVNSLNCGSGYPNSCQMPHVYGPSTLNGNGIGGLSTLPITLSDFSATLNNTTVSLAWITQQEENASRFVIERSSDGVQWKTAGIVFANGNTSRVSKYSFKDDNPAVGVNYYRLKMVDVDESFEYSAVRTVTIQQAIAQHISVYPNPAQNFVQVSIPQTGVAATVRLLNTTGQVLQERTVAGGTVTIPVQQYTEGTYFIQVLKADGFRQSSAILISK